MAHFCPGGNLLGQCYVGLAASSRRHRSRRGDSRPLDRRSGVAGPATAQGLLGRLRVSGGWRSFLKGLGRTANAPLEVELHPAPSTAAGSVDQRSGSFDGQRS